MREIIDDVHVGFVFYVGSGVWVNFICMAILYI